MDESSLKKELESMLHRILSLENRVEAMEKKLAAGASPDATLQAEHPAPAPWAATEMKSDIQSEGTQMGWLGLVISLLSFGFFVRYSFMQNWITGWGQPAMLGAIGTLLIIAGFLFRKKGHARFGITLGACGAAALYLFCYWPSGYLQLTTPLMSVISSGVLAAALIAWGFRRDSSLWPMIALVGSFMVPLMIYSGGFGNPELAIYYFVMTVLFIAAAFVKNWHWLPAAGSILGHLAIIITLRGFRENAAASAVPLEWAVILFAALLIVWSGAAHLGSGRAPQRKELAAWGANTALLYLYLIAFWSSFANPYLLLVPVGAGIILYGTAHVKLPESPSAVAYKAGLVISAAVAFTILMPPPFDIASLCLFSVLLAYLGNRRQQWDLKGLSGALVAWSIIFLVVARLRFSSGGDIPFINLRFASFVVAFLCFGFQGRMINYDASAGKFGPLLGQGLFSLGLLVLMIGMGGETVHLLPAGDEQSISEAALLALTILGGILSLTTAALGLLMDLKYLRLVALAFFIALVAKLAFIDLPRMGTLNLVLSLSAVGALLASASIMYKVVGSKLKIKSSG